MRAWHGGSLMLCPPGQLPSALLGASQPPLPSPPPPRGRRAVGGRLGNEPTSVRRKRGLTLYQSGYCSRVASCESASSPITHFSQDINLQSNAPILWSCLTQNGPFFFFFFFCVLERQKNCVRPSMLRRALLGLSLLSGPDAAEAGGRWRWTGRSGPLIAFFCPGWPWPSVVV